MNTPDKSSMLERSTTVRFCRWLFSWRGLRRLLILLAWLVTLIALFHGEETWRGRRAWNQYRRELEAQGAQLDFAALVPKPVPDEQNFAATPVIKSWFEKPSLRDLDKKWDDNYSRVGERVSPPKTKDARAERRFEDLVAWETAFVAVRSGELAPQQKFYSGKLDAASRAQAAPAVLVGLKTNEALFAELRVASQRPYSRYAVNYDVESPFAILLPHLKMVKGVCQRLQLKTCAELAGGQSDQALEDLKLMFRLADSVKEEPFLISHLVRLGCAQRAVQPIWEGLAEHRWSDAQLQELETRLQQYNFIADTKKPLATEQAAGIAIIELVRKKGLGYLNYLDNPEEAPTAADGKLANFIGFVLVPRGWYDQEELNYCRGFNLQLATALDTAKQRVSPTRVKADAEALYQMMCPTGFAGTPLGRILHHRVMAQMLLPALGQVILRSATIQTAFNQAAIACALERYRLANGHFPEKLEALAPRFMSPLPNDVLTGEPYKYRLRDDGRFVLYSVGWDEKDDGGVPGKTLFDDKQGDWVWEYPAK
jgi:hypothetical protein